MGDVRVSLALRCTRCGDVFSYVLAPGEVVRCSRVVSGVPCFGIPIPLGGAK